MTQQNAINYLPAPPIAALQAGYPTTHLHIWGMGKITTSSTRFFNTTLLTTAELCRYATIDTPALGDTVEYEVLLKAGSYSLVIYGQKSTDRGVVGFYIDNRYVGRFDLYAASATPRNLQVVDFTIASSGWHSVKVVTVGKNSASSNYFLSLSAIHIRPQAITLITPFQPIRINCGATTDYTDPSGNLWVPSLFSDGLGSNYDIESFTGPYTVTGTDKQTLYKTETSLEPGTFSYKLPIFNPGAGHILNLHFSENNKTAANQRVGTVALNGANILTDFDIFVQAGGRNKALIKTFNNLNLTACVITITNTLINAIELLKV